MLCRGGGKYTISAGEVQREGDSRSGERRGWNQNMVVLKTLLRRFQVLENMQKIDLNLIDAHGCYYVHRGADNETQ